MVVMSLFSFRGCIFAGVLCTSLFTRAHVRWKRWRLKSVLCSCGVFQAPVSSPVWWAGLTCFPQPCRLQHRISSHCHCSLSDGGPRYWSESSHCIIYTNPSVSFARLLTVSLYVPSTKRKTLGETVGLAAWRNHSSGAVWESRWPSWAVRPNEPSGFRGRKAILNHASALVSACP